MMKQKYLFCTIIVCLYYTVANAQEISAKAIDSIVNKALITFNVPGIAVSVIKDDKVFLNKGYGYRSLEGQKKTDENTLFGIASNSKAFTAAALAILVDEGKLKWDDKLTQYIPEFKMYEPYVTREFTISDMLSHRSGLGFGAGDLLHNPDSTNYTIKDIIYALRWIKPEASFRSHYAYDNIFYLVAVELIRRISGQNWGDFIHDHIMLPLQMNNSGASYSRIKGDTNVIDGYEEVNGKLVKVAHDDSEEDSGAGGIYASAADMSKWMLLQLNNGRYGAALEKTLFSAKAQADMWTPQIFIPVSKNDGYNTHFGAYGFGWFLNDAAGYEIVSHTGQDNGMISEVTLIPELHAGITVLSNRDGGGAVIAITEQLSDYFLNIKGIDRIAKWKAKVDQKSHTTDTAGRTLSAEISRIAALLPKNMDYSYITGTYNDPWFGEVIIYSEKGRLYFRSKRSLQLHGEMFPYQTNTYLVKWADRKLDADAFVYFKIASNGVVNMTMKRALPETSFAYDFQDLNFSRE
jgi:CubicO group peptidase (beta-lactamase class C family)